MIIRLAAIGAALVAGGLINVGGFGKITVPLGVVVLLSSGILWLVRRRGSSTRR
ncbi:hypothetical protein [Micromonospora sp. KC606]|uniref:hypothetical protein n=1 Tax=Micromonospora sp. KC606 TaxID=2530379 RepID=UPI00140548C5|nr:hypothetical protein [Micromonospora sp. KC606]